MARPKANQLTERELEIMQVFWDDGELTAAEVREQLASTGRDLAYTKYNVGIADGSVHSLDKTLPTETLDHLLEKADGHVIDYGVDHAPRK